MLYQHVRFHSFRRLKFAGYDAVKRWTKKVDIFQFYQIFVPIHSTNHWTLAVIFVKDRSIKYFDSNGGHDNGVLFDLEKYLKKEYSKTKLKELTKYTTEIVKETPRQSNDKDCGVFMLCTAEHISRNEDLDFDDIHMSYYRKKMAYEILHFQLL